MTRLSAKVFRSGETVSKWNFETEEVSITKTPENEIQMTFKIASKGGGVTDVALRVSQLGFDALLNEMWKAAPDHVTKLMVRQMHNHFWD